MSVGSGQVLHSYGPGSGLAFAQTYSVPASGWSRPTAESSSSRAAAVVPANSLRLAQPA